MGILHKLHIIPRKHHSDEPQPQRANPGPISHADSLASPQDDGTGVEAPIAPRAEAAGARRREQPPGQESTWRHTFSSLSNRNYRYFWVGMLFQMSALDMQMLARGFLVFDITSSPLRLSLVVASNALPLLGFSLVGGAMADRLERKQIVQIGQGASGLLAVAVAVAIITDTITWQYLLVASMLQGTFIAFAMPARQAIIPQLVGRQSLNNAFALSSAGMSVAFLVAPAAAGGLYRAFGPGTVYFIIAAMNAVAILFTTLLPKVERGPEQRKTTVLTDIKAGLSYVRQSPLVLVLLLIGLSTAMLSMPFRHMLNVVVVDIYHRGPGSMGLMLMMLGLGSLIGSLFIAGIGQWRRGLLLIAGIFIIGIAILMVSLLPYFFAGLGIMALLGLGEAARRTLSQGLLLEISEDAYRGRVMSLYMMNFGFTSLGILPVGVAAEFLGVRVAIGIVAVLVLVVGLLFLATQKRLRVVQ